MAAALNILMPVTGSADADNQMARFHFIRQIYIKVTMDKKLKKKKNHIRRYAIVHDNECQIFNHRQETQKEMTYFNLKSSITNAGLCFFCFCFVSFVLFFAASKLYGSIIILFMITK